MTSPTTPLTDSTAASSARNGAGVRGLLVLLVRLEDEERSLRHGARTSWRARRLAEIRREEAAVIARLRGVTRGPITA